MVVLLTGTTGYRNAAELKQQLLRAYESELQVVVRLTSLSGLMSSIAQLLLAAQRHGASIELGCDVSEDLTRLLQSTKTLTFDAAFSSGSC